MNIAQSESIAANGTLTAKTHTIHHHRFLLVYVVKHYPQMADVGQTSEEQFVIQIPQHIREPVALSLDGAEIRLLTVVLGVSLAAPLHFQLLQGLLQLTVNVGGLTGVQPVWGGHPEIAVPCMAGVVRQSNTVEQVASLDLVLGALPILFL